MGFIEIFGRSANGFHKRAKLLELNFFVWKTFLLVIKPRRQNFPLSRSVIFNETHTQVVVFECELTRVRSMLSLTE